MLSEIHQRQVAELAPVIGEDAALTAVRVNQRYLISWVSFAVIALPFGLWAELGNVRLPWVASAAGVILGIVAAVWGASLDRRSARLASDFVSAKIGYRIDLRPSGWRPTAWAGAIDKQRAKHEASQPHV